MKQSRVQIGLEFSSRLTCRAFVWAFVLVFALGKLEPLEHFAQGVQIVAWVVMIVVLVFRSTSFSRASDDDDQKPFPHSY